MIHSNDKVFWMPANIAFKFLMSFSSIFSLEMEKE